MRTALIFLTSLVFVSATFGEDEPIGRYQLVSGTVEITTKSASFQQHAVFRIDTKTGKAWVYTVAAVGKDGKLMEYWSEVPEVKDVTPER